MKIASLFRAFIATLALSTAAHASAAPTLLVDSNGILTGAKNVDVAGTLYNVTFAEGTCGAVYGGCDPSFFTFTTQDDALGAAQALLDQVFVDGLAGQFNTKTANIFGCASTVCLTVVPHDTFDNLFYAGIAVNGDSGFEIGLPDGAFRGGESFNFDTSTESSANWAIFELASPAGNVPEPSSIALMGLAMAGFAFSRRRKS